MSSFLFGGGFGVRFGGLRDLAVGVLGFRTEGLGVLFFLAHVLLGFAGAATYAERQLCPVQRRCPQHRQQPGSSHVGSMV